MKYTICVARGNDLYDVVKRLGENVELKIALGWTLQGGVSITTEKDKDSYVAIQAMIRKDEDDRK